MKSQQPEQLIRTSCCDCAFAVYDNNTQVDCKFDRIKKSENIIEAYNKDREFFVINRLCNYYRDKAWGYSANDSQKVEQESATSFNILIYFSSLNEEECNHIIGLINTTKYYSDKVNFLLFYDYENYDNVKDGLLKIVNETSQNYHRMNVSICYMKETFISTFITKSKSDFHILLYQEQILNFDIDMINDVNSYINGQFKKGIFFSRNGIDCIHNLTCKSYPQDGLTEQLQYKELMTNILEISKHKKLFIEI